jgi:hypothetical protein
MDLRLFASVVGRFKVLVIAGLILGILLAVLSVTRVNIVHGRPSLSYRKPEEWATYSRLLLNAPSIESLTKSGAGNSGASVYDVQSSIQASLPGLATVYASFVSSDGVRQILARHGRVNGLLAGTPAQVNPYGGGGYLPIVTIEAVSDSPVHAVSLGNRTVKAFSTFVNQQQAAGGVPAGQRINLSVLNAPNKPVLVRGHSKTLPAAVLVVVLFATFGLVFLLENLRPRVRLVPKASELPQASELSPDIARDRAAS